MNPPPSTPLHVGIDVGGTFTDFVVYDPSQNSLTTFKVLSTPADPALAVLTGLASLPPQFPRMIVHGSTVATNALLERKGESTGLIATQGFRDVLAIGRQSRRHLYDWFGEGTDPLVPREQCLEVFERVDCDGRVLQPLDPHQIEDCIQVFKAQGVKAIAISLLFSFVYPTHEQHVAQVLRRAGFFVTASHELVPEFREYERTSTTVINSYVSPVLDRYLGKLEERLTDTPVYIMQSNGGRIRMHQARQQGVRSILSGPAGGVLGAAHMATLAGWAQAISFDMGGTSTDVALIDNKIPLTSEATIAGFPVRVPVMDIHTVGAGGGSIGRVDGGRSLRVGPESAGAVPGPVCYGQGGVEATVTDANVVLGRVPYTGLLGGGIRLDVEQANLALARLAQDLHNEPQGTCQPQEWAALGIVSVVNAQMERAIRVISVERGHNPADYGLISFGGAGGLHACELARSVGIRRVMIPNLASTLSAFGMLVADIRVDGVRTIMVSGDTPFVDLEEAFRPLMAQALEDIVAQGVNAEEVQILGELDVRYQGQSFELTIPFSSRFREDFEAAHERRYGYSNRQASLEIVNIRVSAVGLTQPLPIPRYPLGNPDASLAVQDECRLVLSSGTVRVPRYLRNKLCPGMEISGPALIMQEDTTSILMEPDRAVIDEFANLLVEIGVHDA